MPYHSNGTFCPEWGGCKNPECDSPTTEQPKGCRCCNKSNHDSWRAGYDSGYKRGYDDAVDSMYNSMCTGCTCDGCN